MNNKQWDAVWVNGKIATMEKKDTPYGLIENGGIAVKEGKIVWVGHMEDLSTLTAKKVIDVEGRCITPGFIDCHTHIVYAGNRAQEFEMRLQGVTYEEIARRGGGIRSTVAATRAASFESLFQQSMKRAQALLFEGVTTLEIKSGYGLDLATEIKMLQVAKKIGEELPLTVITTFLGAHTVPDEYKHDADSYVDLVCNDMLPKVVELKLADAVDVFCETVGFTVEQTEKIFKTAKQYGLGIKCHAEQLSHSGATQLATRYQALSVDHIEYLTEDCVRAMAKAGTVAVLLPGAFYFLREKVLPPIDLLRQHHIPMAIATDCNPGTSPSTSLLLMLNMACTLFRLTPEEALLGVTRHAAKALGAESTIGSLQQGKDADFVIWDIQHPAELAYYLGMNSCVGIVKKGVDFLHNLN